MDNLKRNKVIIQYVDFHNGEILAETDPVDVVKSLVWKDTYKRRQAIKKILGDKIMIFQKILIKASQELKEIELKVFSYFLGIMEFENWISITQKEIAKEINISDRAVRKAIKGLKEKGYIQIFKKGRDNFYRIDPSIAWKGDEKSHFKTLTKPKQIPEGWKLIK